MTGHMTPNINIIIAKMASFAVAGEDQEAMSLATSKHTTTDWEEVACTLLEGGFVLTALELYTELLECGQEVSQLRNYFSNPGNFEHSVPHVISGPASSQIGKVIPCSIVCIFKLGGDRLFYLRRRLSL